MILEVFQSLLGEAIEEVKELDPGYSGHASDVWNVKTPTREVIIRSSRLKSEPDNDFWWGCKSLFGIDPRQVMFMEESSKLLNKISAIPAPKTLLKGIIQEKEYIVVEKMFGQVLSSFTNLSYDMLYQFGNWLAQVHSNQFESFGNLVGTKKITKEKFHEHMSLTMEQIVFRYYNDSSIMKDELSRLLIEISKLRYPELCTPILIDMDPSQFLVSGNRITAIVDTEAYVIGPPELDFIGLEYVLDAESSKPFINGYTSILNIPDLTNVRMPYRFLYRIMGVQGSVGLEKWYAQPSLF